MLFGDWWLFTQHVFHLSCSMCQDLTPFNGQIRFCCMYVLHFVVYGRLGGLHNIYFSQLWSLKVWDQGASTVRFLVRSLFWATEGPLPAVSSLGGEWVGGSRGLAKTLPPRVVHEFFGSANSLRISMPCYFLQNLPKLY